MFIHDFIIFLITISNNNTHIMPLIKGIQTYTSCFIYPIPKNGPLILPLSYYSKNVVTTENRSRISGKLEIVMNEQGRLLRPMARR